MRLVIKPSYDEVSAYAAEHVIGRINAASPTAERPFVLGLPTGSSPVGMYRCIVEAVKEGRVSFRNVVTFNMDEYVGLSEGNPDSYHAFMRRHLFDHIDCPAENINILDGNAPDLEKECARYEEKIKGYGWHRPVCGRHRPLTGISRSTSRSRHFRRAHASRR